MLFRNPFAGLFDFLIKEEHRYILSKIDNFYSQYLKRNVILEICLPFDYHHKTTYYPLLILNDGQDSKAIKVRSALERLTNKGEIKPIISVSIFAGNRMHEYGITNRPDYKGRGSLAAQYAEFVVRELIPYIQAHYRVHTHQEKHVIAGYSLGGLSAFDIAWHHPETFSKVGVFSGSFWWRWQAVETSPHPDACRIAHDMVRKTPHRPNLKFWFQTGTLDETDDRNHNGIIDAIDDTLDMVVELTYKGYRPFHDIQYYEIKGGTHTQMTWREAIPVFLKWAFGIDK